MRSQSQISATISASTKEKLEDFVRHYGLRKNFVVEQSLLYFMEARRELPDEAFLPTRIVVESEAFDRLLDGLEDPPDPTESLKDLMREDQP